LHAREDAAVEISGISLWIHNRQDRYKSWPKRTWIFVAMALSLGFGMAASLPRHERASFGTPVAARPEPISLVGDFCFVALRFAAVCAGLARGTHLENVSARSGAAGGDPEAGGGERPLGIPTIRDPAAYDSP
jgi:hypothetical protein